MTKQERQRVFEKFERRCAYCGTPLKLNEMQVDHLNPIFRTWDDETLKRNGYTRGKDSFENWIPACRSCNKRKGALTVEEFRRELELTYTRMIRDNANFRQLERFGVITKQKDKITFYFEGKQ